mgnify:CR=1 FL=1
MRRDSAAGAIPDAGYTFEQCAITAANFAHFFIVRWVEAGALQLGLSIPPRFVAQPRLLNRVTGIPGLTTGAITELLGTEALALLVKG